VEKRKPTLRWLDNQRLAQPFDLRHQRVKRERLADCHLDSPRVGGFQQHRCCGQQAYWNVVGAIAPAKLLEKAPAIHGRHHQIEQDGVGRMLVDLIERIVTVHRRRHGVPSILQGIRQQMPDRIIVLDDQDTFRQSGAFAPVSHRAAERQGGLGNGSASVG